LLIPHQINIQEEEEEEEKYYKKNSAWNTSMQMGGC
jgi:hypothetical protein